jgi:CPA2 family monovalent cation:H+ antiporter-2
MGSTSFIQDLAVVLTAAGFAAVICHRLNQPKMLGYIIVGLFLGPHTPPFSFIQDEVVIHTLAELGVLFLMVSLGLDFSFRRFRSVGAQASIGAVLDCGLMVGLG